MGIVWIWGIVAFFAVVCVIGLVRKEEKEELDRYDSINEEHMMKVIDARTLKTARENLEAMEQAYAEASDSIPVGADGKYVMDLQEAREIVSGLEEDDWERRAVKHLDRFIDCYLELTDSSLETFKDVELFFKTKRECISEWQSYFAVDVSEYDTRIYPKRYMREYLGDDYDPCMESHEALEKKLDEYVQRMRPEQKRKDRLYEHLVNYVYQCKTVPQAELLNAEFSGFVESEVKCCYRELIKRDRLVKTKMGNRWFVSLSDKELSKKKYRDKETLAPEEPAEKIPSKITEETLPSEIVNPLPPQKPETPYSAALRLLHERKEKYVDKTPSGGSLYFYSEEIAEILKKAGHMVSFAPNGTKGTEYRPAWYVK